MSVEKIIYLQKMFFQHINDINAFGQTEKTEPKTSFLLKRSPSVCVSLQFISRSLQNHPHLVTLVQSFEHLTGLLAQSGQN